MSTFAIILSLVLLIFFAYRGISVLILAPLMAALAVFLSGDIGFMLPIYTDTFMGALGRYILNFFPLFLLGALFGQLMADSGAANAIAQWLMRRLGARHAIATVVLACAVLTYGGVSLFVVAFAIYPIAKSLFRESGIPKRLIPASIALGSFTFTMTALPGTPAIQNAIPIPFFGTHTFAAPGLGIIAGLIMLGLGLLWINTRARAARLAGEGYGEDDPRLELQAAVEGVDLNELARSIPLPLAVLPLVLVIGINALLTFGVFKGMDFSFMGERFPKVDAGKQSGMWAIIVALLVSSLVLIVTRWSHWSNLKHSINKGTLGSMLPIFNTASEVGYGAVIASMAGFALIRDAVLNVSPGNPLISEAVAMNVLAGITGSSSGGMSIALQALGADYLRMATEAGIPPELLHRVATIAAGGFDTLPHSGAVITLLAICGLTHKQAYLNMAMVTVGIPMLALVSVITLGTMFGAF